VKLIAIANHKGKRSCLRNSSEHWERQIGRLLNSLPFDCETKYLKTASRDSEAILFFFSRSGARIIG